MGQRKYVNLKIADFLTPCRSDPSIRLVQMLRGFLGFIHYKVRENKALPPYDLCAVPGDALTADLFHRRLQILLYVPNLVDYLRVALFLAAFLLAGPSHPGVLAALYILCFALDGVDGYLARELHQVRAPSSLPMLAAT